MYQLMKAYANSGQTQQSFREAHGLPRSTFQYWWRRYRESKQGGAPVPSPFIALEVEPPSASAPAAGIVITYVDGTRVEVHRQVEASFIRQLLER